MAYNFLFLYLLSGFGITAMVASRIKLGGVALCCSIF